MQLKKIKALSIIIVVGIIAVAGWMVGIKTFMFKQDNSNIGVSPSNDVLVYAVKESEKIAFYKSGLNKIDPKMFYTLTDNEAKGYYLSWLEKSGVVFEITNPPQIGPAKYFQLALNGTRKEIMAPQMLGRAGGVFSTNNLTRKAVSFDGKLSAKVESEDPEAPSPDVKLIIQGESKTMEIPVAKIPHYPALRSFFPQAFSLDNKFLFFIILETPGDIGAIGLFKINLEDNNISEIAYEENKGADYSLAHPASSIYLQPSTEFAYITQGKELIRVNTQTGEKTSLYSSIPEGYLAIFPPDEKVIILNPPFDAKQPIQVFDISTKIVKTLPVVSGEFKAISSDKNYLIYSKYSEEFSDTPFSNKNIINSENRKIQITEYHIHDVVTGKDNIIFTNKMILSDSGNYVGLDGKEYTFVGLISSESK